jgi:hypothetical protein
MMNEIEALLIKYGFVKDQRGDWVMGEIRITIFDYMQKQGDGKEVNKRTFVINTKRSSSMSRPLSDLENWLNENIKL